MLPGKDCVMWQYGLKNSNVDSYTTISAIALNINKIKID